MGSVEVKRSLVDAEEELSIRRQCQLLSISRGSVYYRPKGESTENLEMMRLMDQHILAEPTASSVRLRWALL